MSLLLMEYSFESSWWARFITPFVNFFFKIQNAQHIEKKASKRAWPYAVLGRTREIPVVWVVGWWVASLLPSRDTDPTRATSPPPSAGKRQFCSDSPITYTVSTLFINSNDLNCMQLRFLFFLYTAKNYTFFLLSISAALTSFTLTVVIGLIVSAVPSSPSVDRSGQKLNICQSALL